MQMYLKSIAFSDRIVREHVRGGRLLDVGGGGQPRRSKELAEIADEVVVLDISPPVSPLAPGIRFLQLPVERLAPEHGPFDHVLLSNVLEHVEDPLRALRSVVGVLASAGRVHILSPNCESLNRRIGVLMGVLKSIREIPAGEIPMGHRQTFTVGDMRELIRQAGLELRECRGVFLKPVPTGEMIAWPEERIRAFFEIAAQVPPDLCHEVYFMATRR
ncbi:MAG: class I SAM-dependent methyltransferase [Lentisphaerae bacterium]|nr:class I SAM-dependent methyltransferase [Lentisphaerota bacterium]